MRRYYLFIAGLCVLAAAVLASAYVIRRAPLHDARVTADLELIRSALPTSPSDPMNQYRRHLPASLAGLALPVATRQRLSNYRYVVTGPTQYQLCASFETSTTKTAPATAGYGTYADFSAHPKGYYCFQIDQTS